MRIQNSRCWKPWDWVVEEDSNWHQGLEPLRHQLVECQWQGRGGPRYSTAHPPSFETHDWPAAADASSGANSLQQQRPCGTDLISQQSGSCAAWRWSTFSVTCCRREKEERTPTPNRHVSHDHHTLTHGPRLCFNCTSPCN